MVTLLYIGRVNRVVTTFRLLPRKTKLNTASGFSLIELLIVLGVISILLVAAFVLYPNIVAANMARSEATHINLIAANTRHLYKNGNYFGLRTTTANQARFFSSNMNGGDYSATAAIKNGFGSDVVVQNGETVSPGRAPTFLIGWWGVTDRVCVPLVLQVEARFDKIQVNSINSVRTVKDTSSANPALHTLNVAALADGCSQEGDGTGLALSFEGR